MAGKQRQAEAMLSTCFLKDAEYMLFEGYAIACAKIAPESDSCGVSWMS